MKYEKIVCWVNSVEKQDIKTENIQYNIPIVFAKNHDEFKSLIDEKSYLVLSVMKAKYGYKKVCKLVREFPDLLFHTIRRMDNEFTTANEFFFLEEINVVRPYDGIDLIKDYLK